MSHPQTTAFEESKYESLQEQEYWKSLLSDSLASSRAKKWQAVHLRTTALKMLSRGILDATAYAQICKRNELLLF